MSLRGCCTQIISAVVVVFLLHGLASSKESNVKNILENKDRIDVIVWNVGAGNFFTPNAYIVSDIYSVNSAEIKLFSVKTDGATIELQSFACPDGGRISFNAKYNRGETKSLEIRLYDNKKIY